MRINRKLFVAIKSVAGLLLLFLAFYGSHFSRIVQACVSVAAAIAVAWDIRISYRRMRPRGRMQMAVAIFGGLILAFALMAVAVLDDKEPGWEWMAGGFITLCAVCIAGSVWSCVRMRRLCGEARQRLWELRKILRRRAIAAGREVYR